MTREFSPDVVILDLKLPDGNGLGLLEPLMSNDPAPKIIVFSSTRMSSSPRGRLVQGLGVTSPRMTILMDCYKQLKKLLKVECF